MIQTRTIVGKTDGPHLLITGGVHGDEYEPMVAIRRLTRLLDSSALRGRVTVAPVVNESAFQLRQRCGADGLDLARTCPGKADGSITEQVAHDLSQLIQSADYYIDLHTGGTTISVFPLVGYMLHSDPGVLETQRAMARSFNLPIVWGTSASLDGRSLSVARDAKVPALYAEYLGAATCSPEGVEAYVAGCLNVMATLGMIEREPPTPCAKIVVEDNRKNAGYMQIQNPAPHAGYFETAVSLGEKVEVGQPLGKLSNVLGNEETPILSTQEGIVLVLRTTPYVETGDSVAVILEEASFSGERQ